MSNLNQFIGEPAVTSIVNGFSDAGATAIGFDLIDNAHVTKAVTSGALTANTLDSVLNITGGGGYLDFLWMASGDATSRTHRMKITIDGTVVMDSTSAAVATAKRGFIVVGQAAWYSTINPQPIFTPVRFNSSCLVEYASSLTETDKTNMSYAYRLTN